MTVLEEIPDKAVLFKEIHDSLKEGGWLSITEAIADPHFQTYRNVQDLAVGAGFKEIGFFGNRISFTVILEGPYLPSAQTAT